MALPEFIFGGNTGTPTYQELLRRRAIATAQAGRQRKLPTTFGEGLTYLGEAVGDRLESNRLTEAERALGAREDKIRGGAPVGGGYVPTAGGAAGPAAAAAAPVLDAGSPLPSEGRDRIAAAINGAPQEVASLDPTAGAATPPGFQSEEARWNARTTAPDDVEGWKHAIGGIESSQDYRAVGVPTKYGRALGRYGVMEANVPKWTQEIFGRPMTPQQFLADDKAQDAVFKHRFGQYVAKYGEEKAARAWYGGEGNINNLNAMDAHEKLTVRDYGQDFLRRLQGKRADAGEPDDTAPVQLASLAGPGDTMTDALPPGMGGSFARGRMMPQPLSQQPHSPAVPWPANPAPAPNWTPPTPDPNTPPQVPSTTSPRSDVENPDQPTVTEDIKPMSVRPQQVAQIGAEMFSPRRMSDAPLAMGPNQVPLPAVPGAPAGVSGEAPAMPPSAGPMPAASEQEIPHEGPEPRRPGPLPPSKQQQYWQRFIDSPNASPELQAHAQRMYNAEEVYRREISGAQQNEYIDKREAWQAARLARQKHEREAGDRRIKQSIDLHGLEKTRQELAKGYFEAGRPRQQALDKADLEIDEARGRIAEQTYKAGTQRTQEQRQRELNIQESERKLAAPETKEIGGVIYERTPATPGTPAGEWTPAKGSPKKETKITETDSKSLFGFRRATIAASQLPGDASILAGLKDTATGKIPIAGNYWVSPEYQRANSAAGAWIRHTIRHESGAAITPSEVPEFYPVYFPVPGDKPDVIAAKTVRRREATKSMMDGLSGDARAVATQFLEERKTRRAVAPDGTPYPEGSTRFNKTGVKQRAIGGYWESEDDLD